MKHKFPYRWNLSETEFSKNRGKVFSTFSCGGGSSMGYKLAGFDVIGSNDIDPEMMDMYIDNHKPGMTFLESITTLKDREDLPEELYNLDILDGSPPCSTFSMAGSREKAWGEKKKFREGQADQVLDTLFFDFIDLAARLKPKVVIAENVKGLLLGQAFNYVRQIYDAFDAAGYYCQHWLLDASKMGVPQRRERVFFICLRKDLAGPFMRQKDLFTQMPHLELEFNEPPIIYSQIEDREAEHGEVKVYPSVLEMWERTPVGKEMFRNSGHQAISHSKLDPSKVLPTIISGEAAGAYHYDKPRSLTRGENCLAGSFPLDYDFKDNCAKYVVGMSVPPVMMAQIAAQVDEQWLSQIS